MKSKADCSIFSRKLSPLNLRKELRDRSKIIHRNYNFKYHAIGLGRGSCSVMLYLDASHNLERSGRFWRLCLIVRRHLLSAGPVWNVLCPS